MVDPISVAYPSTSVPRIRSLPMPLYAVGFVRRLIPMPLYAVGFVRRLIPIAFICSKLCAPFNHKDINHVSKIPIDV